LNKNALHSLSMLTVSAFLVKIIGEKADRKMFVKFAPE